MILNFNEIISKTPKLFTNKKIVLTGGCFDLLHRGHLLFLEKAKLEGDYLIVLLESDNSIKIRKGQTRPIETQKKRAENLLKQSSVDLIILLPERVSDSDYDNLVSEIKPAIIATTKKDPSRFHKERQAQLVGAKVIDVIERLPQYSTTKKINEKHEN